MAREEELTSEIAKYTEALTELETQRENYTNYKKNITNCFNRLYARFIQEGSWVDQNYVNDDQYYIDAVDVLHNSTLPSVSYKINAVDMSGANGYELLAFHLGDRTYVEDPEFFGYAADGITPYREPVVITEITYCLDTPNKNSFKIQNYTNQFADFFKSVAATVQSVQFTAGSYQKAASLAQANTEQKLKYLNDALNSVDCELTGIGAQTVQCDETGITIISKYVPDNQLRLFSGGILLRHWDEQDHTVRWTTAIDANGICADTINAGTLNTEKVVIMNGGEATFLWDSYGLTAFGLDSDNAISPFDWVRFNKFGIFGMKGAVDSSEPMTGVDGRNYKPNTIDEIKNNQYSTFGLTHNGFWFYGTNGVAKTEIDGTGIRIYKKDAQNPNIDLFKVDDQGNVFVRGDIEANSGKLGENLDINNDGISFAPEMIVFDELWSPFRNYLGYTYEHTDENSIVHRMMTGRRIKQDEGTREVDGIEYSWRDIVEPYEGSYREPLTYNGEPLYIKPQQFHETRKLTVKKANRTTQIGHDGTIEIFFVDNSDGDHYNGYTIIEYHKQDFVYPWSPDEFEVEIPEYSDKMRIYIARSGFKDSDDQYEVSLSINAK